MPGRRNKNTQEQVSPKPQSEEEMCDMAAPHVTEPTVSEELQTLRTLLVSDLKEMIETLINKALASIQKSLDNVHLVNEDHKKRIAGMETALNDYSDRVVTLEKVCERLDAENKLLLSSAIEAEDRSRKFNVRVMNIDEKYTEGQNATQFMSKFLVEAMGEVFSSPPVIDAAHRVGPLRPGGKPRVMIVRFHYFQDKVRALAADRNRLEWRGQKVRIFADFSPTTSKQRASYAHVKSLLYNKKVKFRLVYPAVLRVEYDNKTHNFKSPEEAQRFYDRHFSTDK